MPNPFFPTLSPAWQAVYATASAQTPVLLASPVVVTDFNTSPLVPTGGNPYGEYIAAVQALAPWNATWGDGVRIGYGILTSAPLEGAIACYASRALATRVQKKLVIAYAQGAIDVWTLLVGANGNIAAALPQIS